MKKIKSILLTLLILVCITYISADAADKAPSKTAAFKPAGEAEFRKIMGRGSAVEEQNRKVLAPLLGTWEFTAVFWAKPGVEPSRTDGVITNELIYEGRYLSSTVLGSLDVAGHTAPVKAQGFIGYDNTKKAFTSVWLDNLSTGMMTGSGKYDEKEKVLKETGKFTDPMDGLEKPFRSEIRIIDEANYKRTIFVTGKSGKETKLMEFEYRKKI